MILQALLYVFAILAAFLFYHHCTLRWGKYGKLIDKIPGPPAWPLIGNLLLFIVPQDRLWDVSHEMTSLYGSLYRVWSWRYAVVNLSDPHDVEALLSSPKHISKSLLYDFMRPWLGNGLLTSTGDRWRERRKILTPAFHFNVLQQFSKVFMEQANKLKNTLCSDGEPKVYDLTPLLHKYTLNSICETAMGTTSLSDDEVLHTQYRSCVSQMGLVTIYRIIHPWLHVNWIYKFSDLFKKQVAALNVLHGFSRRIIKERKKYHEETNREFFNEFDDENDAQPRYVDETRPKGNHRPAMLDLMISAASRPASRLDDEGIREEVDTFVFEGHDTTAMALTFTLLLLAENKEFQDKARAEIDEIFAEKKSTELTMNDIQGLAYVERCIKESLRLFPSVPFISRHIYEDLKLKNYLIPKDTITHIHIFDLHRNPKHWPDPDRFDPDRFLPENARNRHPYAFVPFSAGPRNCIGKKFGMLELKSLICVLLRDFYVEPVTVVGDVKIIADLILRTKNPVYVKFVPRSRDIF